MTTLRMAKKTERVVGSLGSMTALIQAGGSPLTQSTIQPTKRGGARSKTLFTTELKQPLLFSRPSKRDKKIKVNQRRREINFREAP